MPRPRCSANWPKMWRSIFGPGALAPTSTATEAARAEAAGAHALTPQRTNAQAQSVTGRPGCLIDLPFARAAVLRALHDSVTDRPGIVLVILRVSRRAGR